MTSLDPRQRIAAATEIATQLRDLVLKEAERGFRLAWYDKLRKMIDILGTDDDPAEVLKYASLTYDQLYAGGRSFGDFIISRTDPQELVEENRKLARLTGELGKLLHDR